jgi:hypothetical protein
MDEIDVLARTVIAGLDREEWLCSVVPSGRQQPGLAVSTARELSASSQNPGGPQASGGTRLIAARRTHFA